ncbi:cysteine desulfurase family protein [Rhodococcus sp. SGAir0479]|uniref:cysteine desulfurase family protein n=1 Tax=Rhodococcus sp. SGAir0479 TaxID=2567884 RepID=UPI0010CCC798|nr:cysteine desulfurase family protein [Rhodococcus sp. SGAir0479]QCQ91862.1 cysteine desulfurase [Rhodococcus sp. SGAir0479]
MISPAHSSAVYLDHAATTPMYPATIEAMTEVFASVGNASSLHGSGRAARRRIEESREAIAACLGARPSEVIFTSGGTESDNLAVKGIFWARRDADPRRTRILASAVEHHAVLDSVEWLVAHEGAQVTWLPVDATGAVDPEVVRAELAVHADETALVTVMWANNETGTINPIREIAAVAAEHGVPIHSDAVQAAAHLPIDFAASGLSALSVAGHKLGGPQGVGALLLGRQVPCVPLSHGGGHERDLRSGTQDTASIVGLASALRITAAEMDTRGAELTALRDRLIDGVRDIAPDAVLNGPAGSGRLPGNAHFTFPGCEGDSLLMLLDVAGVECSTGSACTAGVASASHVLTAMGVDPVVARGSLRFSLGHNSTERDVETLLSVLPQVIERARAAGMASAGARGGNR